jgi:ATP-binding cassette subfamily C (CFTR/MRP) protein 1
LDRYDSQLEVKLKASIQIVDAHVGKALFHGAILGLRDVGKSVILVTHALHFLSNCDYIYTLDDGRIAEHGTYDQLISNQGEFARLDKEFGGNDAQAPSDEKKLVSANDSIDAIKLKSFQALRNGASAGTLDGKLIVKERRTTGSISWTGTKTFFNFISPHLKIPSVFFLSDGGAWLHYCSISSTGDSSDARKPNLEYLYFGLVASKVSSTVL